MYYPLEIPLLMHIVAFSFGRMVTTSRRRAGTSSTEREWQRTSVTYLIARAFVVFLTVLWYVYAARVGSLSGIGIVASGR